MSLIFNGIEPNNVIWNGIETTGMYNGETLWGSSLPPYYTLTLSTDGHGTLTANTLTGYPGDTITLSPTYNTYYRFNNYSVTGGTIANNTFTFGNEDATAQANFKVNYFTATGNFNWSNWSQAGKNTTSKTYNGIVRAFTGSRPASWPANGAAWNVTNASAYSVTSNATFKVTHGQKMYSWNVTVTGAIQAGSTNLAGPTTKTVKATTAGVNVLSLAASNKTTQGQLKCTGNFHNDSQQYSVTWSMPTNNWTAKGIAP